MKTKIIIFLSLVMGLAMVSCEGSYDFEKEQYKKVVYIMGGTDDFHIFDRSVADLNQAQDTFYITVGVGGSLAPDQDVTVTIADADSLFNAYNKSNYDIDSAKFAQLLKPEFYTIASKKAIIKAGTSTATIPVVLKDLDKLSPDTTYFLNYQIENISAFEKSKDNSEALFRIYYKNRWSNTKKTAIYNLSAREMTYDVKADTIQKDTTVMAGSPKVFPLTKNSVRVAVASTKYEKAEEIKANSFIIEIADQPISKTDKSEVYPVTIKQYGDMEVEQMNPTDPLSEYKNIFIDEKRQITPGVYTYFKHFLLRFKYQDPADKKGKKFKVIEKKLSVQYNPKEEL